MLLLCKMQAIHTNSCVSPAASRRASQADYLLPEPLPPTSFAAAGVDISLPAAGAWLTAAIGATSPA